MSVYLHASHYTELVTVSLSSHLSSQQPYKWLYFPNTHFAWGNSSKFYDITNINFNRKVRDTATAADSTGPHLKGGEAPHQPPINDVNISQTPENASGENGVRHSIAPDIGSAAFKNWFADSKVVDQKGEPLVMYHGSSAVFYAFDPKKIKSGAFGKGIYLSPSKANTRA